MKVYAQQKGDFLVEVSKRGNLPYGFVVNVIKQEVLPKKETSLFSLVRDAYWEAPNISKEAEEKVLKLVEKHIERNKKED